LSTQNVLLKLEVQGLKKALVNEKKRRQRGKALQLEMPLNQDGGAIFWSPNKVQLARERETQKAEAARAERLQKEEDSQRRAIEKAEKQRALEERRRMKATAKEIRLQEQARKQQEKEDNRHARLAAAQLQKDIQFVKQARKVRKKQSIVPQEADSGEQSVLEVIKAPLVTNRRGRHINLPTRY
ncbi:hypothetical protein CC80DRAFT_357101, partial [Byssothecium circinans]